MFTAVQDQTDELIPQANDPERIAAAIAAIDAGCIRADEVAKAIGVHDRQGSYYANAALRLGLVDRCEADHGYTYTLTTQGRALADAPASRQAAVLASVIARDPLVQAAQSNDPDERALVRLACEDAGLTGATVSRRVSTIEAWAAFVSMTTVSQTTLVEQASTGVAARAADVIRERVLREAEAAARAAAAAPQYCGSCRMQLPRSGACDFC